MSPARIEAGKRPGWRVRAAGALYIPFAVTLTACSDDALSPNAALANCSIPLESFTDAGTERSSIPALTNPEVATRLIAPLVGYVTFNDLIIGIEFNGQPLAIPPKAPLVSRSPELQRAGRTDHGHVLAAHRLGRRLQPRAERRVQLPGVQLRAR